MLDAHFSFDIFRSTFGCQWQLAGKKSSETCVPSQRGLDLLGPVVAKEINVVKGHMMITPDDEILYNIGILPEEEYMTEYFGYDPSEKYSEEEVTYAKESYASYVEENSTNSLIALHENDSGGSVIWIGDWTEEDTKMR